MYLRRNRLVVVSLMVAFPLFAQQVQEKSSTISANRADDFRADFSIPEFSPFGFLVTYFPSELIQNGIELKSYIRSRRFSGLRSSFGDRRAVDAIYIRALRLTSGNTAMALLYCCIATMDHRIVGIRIPVLKLFFPLSNESDEEFHARVANLPGNFYQDSPGNAGSDRDKVQHFFGSAFIAYVFESRGAAERVGNFIEWGEDAFIVDGVYDERDMRANRQGQEFGLALLAGAVQEKTDKQILPSDFLTVQVVTKPERGMDDVQRMWCGAW